MRDSVADMRVLLENIFAGQTAPPDAGEGLPYWIFWLLLFVILLLVIFIFLRDKDLRRRINMFFFGAKKKLIKLRLQARLRRENRKKDEIIRDLGKKVWEENIEITKGEKIRQELDRLEENKKELEQESEEAQAKITRLEGDQEQFIQKHRESVAEEETSIKPYQEKSDEIKVEERVLEVKVTEKQKELEGFIRGINTLGDEDGRDMEELIRQKEKADQAIKTLVDKRLDLEKERKLHQEKIEEGVKKIKAIEEGGKKRIHEFHREIKEWKKNQEKLLEKIEHIEGKKEPLFVQLGKQADETREARKELSLFFSQIDRYDQRIGQLEQQIKDL